MLMCGNRPAQAALAMRGPFHHFYNNTQAQLND